MLSASSLSAFCLLSFCFVFLFLILFVDVKFWLSNSPFWGCILWHGAQTVLWVMEIDQNGVSVPGWGKGRG